VCTLSTSLTSLILATSTLRARTSPRPLPSFPNLTPLSPPSGSSGSSSSPRQHARAHELREQASRNASDINLPQSPAYSNGELAEPKSSDLDWYVEGPGRRVAYDDLTAIDWIFEYTKERQRLQKLLAGEGGIVGYARQLLDASHVWLVLVLTGIAVGFLAAAINIAGDWLSDIKGGYCKTGEDGGRFYLNKAFCCWGHDDLDSCQDWVPWRSALKIPSIAGGYVVEYTFFLIYAVLFATCAAFLTKRFSIYARHSGIPEIKTVLGGFVIRRFMGGWTLAIKTVGLCLAVASGLWLGKEGPLVHVACCCANLVMKPFDSLSGNEARKREVLSAAAASGISVAFGAPVGGVLFSLEQLSYYFPDKTMWQSFVCAMVAAVTLGLIDPFHTGKIVLYQVTYTSGWHSFELGPFLLLGVIGGIYGGLFTRLNMIIAKFRRSNHNPLRNSPVLEVCLAALISGFINFPNIFMRAQLSELVYYLFAECAAIGNHDIFGLCKVTTAGSISIVSLLLTAAGLGFLLASVTFGLQIPAGIILPSLAIGALYGRAMGMVVQLFQKHHADWFIFAACEPDVPCVTPGTYAIVGAAAALAGVTRMTVSIVVIMFELTGALSYVLPIMMAVMLAKWVGDVFSKRGIYESWIQFKEYPYLDNKDDTPVPDVPASNIMTRAEEMTCLDAREKHTIESLLQLLERTTYRGFPVISAREPTSAASFHPPSGPGSRHDLLNQILLGYISRTELLYSLQVASAATNSLKYPGGRGLALTSPCYFTHNPAASPRNTLDLRPWMDQTPITLNTNSSFQLAVNMFQKLGLRYLLFVDRGAFCGLLTKKDIWWVLNAGETATKANNFVAGAGVLREEADEGVEHENNEEERGLLREGA
jgi:chloride channel 3/4/5